jgi:RNA polymerase sigma-70 factor, ECF subfamily
MTDALTMNVAEADLLQRQVREADGKVAELTRRLKGGENEAYQEFFSQYARRLLVYHLVLTNGDENLAKELLQETMIRVAKYIRVFTKEEAFWSWLSTVARSCWIDEHRKRKRYWSFLELFRQKSSASSDSIEEARETACSDLLATLASDERELLRRKYVEGRSVKELACAAGKTEKAIESSLSRAREKLKRKFKNEANLGRD